MLEAQKKGYAMPFGFLKSWTNYQKKAARDWRPNAKYSNDLPQAYRLYTLALAGEPELGAMNRLRESRKLSDTAKWKLAAAYAIAGQPRAARSLVNQASTQFESDYYYYSYGSATRNMSMALETLVEIGDKQAAMEMAKSVAKDLNNDKWMSTQTTAYALLAISKMLKANGGKGIDVTSSRDDDKDQLKSNKPLLSKKLNISQVKNLIQLKNNGENLVYVTLNNQGQLPLGSEIALERNLRASISYEDGAGKSIDITQLQQGMDFTAIVKVYNTSNNYINDVALTQIFPSGWEIINTRFTDFGESVDSSADYTDIRDDRVNFYFDLERKGRKNGSKTFKVQLNAAYLGRYYLPGLQVEAMYDNDYLSRNKGKWIEVKR
jgi:uncharacterized protein YfaS (alpha-2-macroglobulin family)